MLKFTANLSLLFTEQPLLKRFKLAKDAGFNAVEIQFPYSESAKDIRTALDENQLNLVLFNVDADDLLQGGEGLAAVPEKQMQFQQAIAQSVAYAEILQPHYINVLPGLSLDSQRTTIYLETFINNLIHALDAFTPLGIKTVFEAINTYDMPGFIIHSSKQMLEILAQINHPDLLLQYDIYHMHMMRESVAEFIKQNINKIGHIQFADCPGRGQPGTGNIDFQALFKVIQTSGYKGWIGAEYIPTDSTVKSLGWFSGK